MSDSAPSIASPVRAQYVATTEELAKGVNAHIRQNFAFKFMRYLGGIMAFCAVFAMIWNKDTFLSVFPMLLLGLFFFFTKQVILWQFRRRFQKYPNKDSQISWSFTQDDLHSQGDGFNFDLAWRKVFQFVDSSDGFLIYPQKQLYYWVPFTAFPNNSEIDCVRQIAKSQVLSYKKVS